LSDNDSHVSTLCSNICQIKIQENSMRLQKGFTLVELMIVVAVIGILSMVALPAYSNYVTRGKVPDATSNLSSKRTQMEQFYQDNRTYVGAPACVADSTASRYFTFSCTVQTATTYTIQAAGTGTMAGFTYTIANTPTDNLKASTIAAPAPTAWRATQAACWITNVGGAC